MASPHFEIKIFQRQGKFSAAYGALGFASLSTIELSFEISIGLNVMAETDKDHPANEIGNRIKSLRRSVGLSQANLGSALGVTFQQVQKYESGRSKIAAEKLHQIAQTLGVDIGYFYDAKSDGNQNENRAYPLSVAAVTENGIFKEAFDRIKDPRARYLISELARVICEIEAGK